MKFSEHLREIANPIWKEIFKHPFLEEMASGKLPLLKFKFYIIQDYLFLIDFSRTLAFLTGRMKEYRHMRELGKLLYSTLTYEMKSLKQLATEIGISDNELKTSKPAPTNYSYTRHMLALSLTSPVLSALSGILPCFWSYMEIPLNLKVSEDVYEVYKNWFSTYKSEEYRDVVELIISIFDELSESSSEYEREDSKEAFIISSIYEYLFWNMAYQLEEWPFKFEIK